MRTNNRGSALLSALILGSVLLLTLSALIGTALSELRGATRSAMNSVAFSLAEAGVDQATTYIFGDADGDTFTSNSSVWTANSTSSPTQFTATFAIAQGSTDAKRIGGMTGSYKVIVQRTLTSSTEGTYVVYSKGTVTNKGGAMTAERAVEVTFSRSVTASDGTGVGCVARSSFCASSTGSSSISSTQVGPTFDSYDSSNNTKPDYATNRDNDCLVGTGSSENGALNLGNGAYFCEVGTGSSTDNPTPTVGYATDASTGGVLATMDDLTTDSTTLVTYDSSLLSRDVIVTTPDVVPPAITTSDGYTIVVPSTGTSNSQWAINGKLTDYSSSDNKSTVSNVSYSSNTLTLGTSDSDKIYAYTSSLDNVKTITVSGSVILVVNGTINASNGMVVNFASDDASLTIYCTGNLSGVLSSTLTTTTSSTASDGTVTTTSTTSANWEASRLTINMMPSYSASASSDTPTTINTKVTSSVASATTSSAGSIIMNFDDSSVFVGSIFAPYSAASLSATGNKRYSTSYTSGKMSDYCGALVAGTLSVTGSNGFAFHFDEDLNTSSSTSPSVTVSAWQQIQANNAVFN